MINILKLFIPRATARDKGKRSNSAVTDIQCGCTDIWQGQADRTTLMKKLKGFMKKSCIWATLSPLVLVWYKSTNTLSYVYVYNMIPLVHVYTIIICPHHELKYIPWVKVVTKSPSLHNDSKYIPWVQIYTMSPIFTMSPSLHSNSKSLLWVLF